MNLDNIDDIWGCPIAIDVTNCIFNLLDLKYCVHFWVGGLDIFNYAISISITILQVMVVNGDN